jgi:tetratricopeptide (TPR) repeat protein
MTPAFALRLRFFCAVLVLCALLAGRTSLAHVSSDDMPDSVAEVEYSIYLEFKPADIPVRNKLGMVYYRLDKLQEAAREFARVLKHDPNNYDALDGMGLVKAAKQDFAAAITYHRQAIAIDADDMMGYFHLGSALEKNGLLREALAEYRNAQARFSKQYPRGTENKQATEFGQALGAAIANLETRL